MADSKGLYYSPQERGVATILPQFNWTGLAAASHRSDLARRKSALDMEKTRRTERNKALEAAYSELSKPVVGDQLWQGEVDDLKKRHLDRLVQMDGQGADPSSVRSFAAQSAQDIASYAAAGKGVAAHFAALNKLNAGSKYKVFRTDELRRDWTEALVDENGGLTDPRGLDLAADYNPEDWAFNRPGGSRYINEGAAIPAFLNSGAVKDSLIEIDEMGKALPVGAGGRMGVATRQVSIKESPFFSTDPASGDVRVKDARGLVESGLLQVAMNDRAMARIIEDEVDNYFLPESAPNDLIINVGVGGSHAVPVPKKSQMSEEDLSYLRAEVLISKLEGYKYRGNVWKERERLMTWQRARPRAEARERAKTADQKEYLSAESYVRAFASGDRAEVNRAIEFAGTKSELLSGLLPNGTIGPNEKLERVVTNGNEVQFSIAKYGDDGEIRQEVTPAEVDANGNEVTPAEYAPMRRIILLRASEIDPEAIRSTHAQIAKAIGRNFGTTETGEVVPETTPEPKKKKKIILPGQ